MLKLYDYFRSSASFRVRIALHMKGLDYECIPVHLVNQGGEQHTDHYKSLNPQCLVPSLIDGNRVLTQSLAIIEYLDETHPSPRLLPLDHYQKCLVRSFALAIAADLHPLNNLRVLNYLSHELHISADQKEQWYQHWMTLTLDALEQQLVQLNHSSTFCFGETPTLADICLVPQLYNARRFDCSLDAYPTLVKIDNACQRIDAFHQAWPKEPVT